MDDELFLETYCNVGMKRCINKMYYICVRWPAAVTNADLCMRE